MKAESAITPQFMGKMRQMNINSKAELLLHLPIKYQDYRKPVSSLKEALDSGDTCYMHLKLSQKPDISSPPGKPAQIKLNFTDTREYASAMVFGGYWDWKDLNKGNFVHITGKVVEKEHNGKIYINIKSIALVPSTHQGQIIPVYKGQLGDDKKKTKKGAPKKAKDPNAPTKSTILPETIGKNIMHALRECPEEGAHLISERAGVGEAKMLKDLGYPFPSLTTLLRVIHRPRTSDELKLALKTARMINGYKTMQAAIAARIVAPHPESMINFSIEKVKSLVGQLPFNLTGDQRRAVWDIVQDLSSNIPMNRLISGDVGCGKTLTYSIPAVCTYGTGKNVVIIMPNTLLASQVASEISDTFPGTNVKLMIGGEKNDKPVDEHCIIVGTTAILFWMERINNSHRVDLLIIDEQQKLGSEQRLALIQPQTNVLQATATAIPRTTAQVMFGAMDVSIIEEPPVVKSISTTVAGIEHRKQVMSELLDIIDEGHQIAILYPVKTKLDCFTELFVPQDKLDEISELLKQNKIQVIEACSALGYQTKCGNEPPSSDGCIIYAKFKEARREEFNLLMDKISEMGGLHLGDHDGDVADVEQAYRLWDKKFPGQVVMIHGGMKAQEKLDAIEIAKAGSEKCKVIVTSSVIEIGLTMPDLRGLLIVHAPKYGAGTLHQFRGRLARKGGSGKFYLMSDKTIAETSDDSLNRLKILEKHTRGSKIAEEDMLQRGFGDLDKSSTVQSGHMDGVFRKVKVYPSDITELLATVKDNSLLVPRREHGLSN